MKSKAVNYDNINKYFWTLYENKEYEKIISLLENYSNDDLLSREQIALIKAYSLELGSNVDFKKIEALYKKIVEYNPSSVQALIYLTYFYHRVLDDQKKAVKSYFKLKSIIGKYTRILEELDREIIKDQMK